MNKKQLFKQDFVLYQSSHQSHITYEFYLPAAVDQLEIRFTYDPLVESNYDHLIPCFEREGIARDKLQKGDAFRNLLTLSVNDPERFRGAHHYFNQEQEIRIGEQEASLGFVEGPLLAGNWQVVISCHGLFSPELKGSLEVVGYSKEDWQVKRAEVLTKVVSGQRQRERPLSDRSWTFAKAELHAHTIHSDADQTAEEIMTEAQARALDWLAITDHNTITAIDEIQINDYYQTDVQLIPGLEFTTFYGHFLLHGRPEYLFHNWTEVNLGNFESYIAQLKDWPVNITIAHPFDQGNPWCTGCHWDYQVTDLSNVDAIEVWNSPNPHLSESNKMAYQAWTDLLAQGYELSGHCGQDWHRASHPDERLAYTYFLLPNQASLEEVLSAHRLGRSYASLRPNLEKMVVNDCYQLGDRINHASTWQVDIVLTKLEEGDQIFLKSAKENLKVFISDNDKYVINTSVKMESFSLLRLEIRDKNNFLIMFTNSIYHQ
ncbi:CehA/McbA family metallohydrolase [Facklamia sp. DSM 111018]|uniref:CehA/McbA family metallohydrolase n=1 Tax=Facklamia lactis TaxID=2749967 RepID=A0ABS0LNH5_9LACT|nr:CehA/McbA family metallohydrolase [Facklamia lactis]MBG9979605.1 CehA/McbA family metallohydrolase [Facklamia lactis]MBG9985715.1 CehA/McbA family metallohydrolase [Facklamia lactis]